MKDKDFAGIDFVIVKRDGKWWPIPNTIRAREAFRRRAIVECSSDPIALGDALHAARFAYRYEDPLRVG